MKAWENRGALVRDAEYFVKWTAVSCVIGVLGGGIGAAFGLGIRLAASLFQDHGWLLFLLPAAGAAIVFFYRAAGQEKHGGTNMILDAVASGGGIPPATAPLICAGTILTHLTGGSAGREGAALQLGGCIGSLLGRAVRLDGEEQKTAVMCGMSACFGALFGTPLAAAVFPLEVVSVGILRYAALVPCVFASFLGAGIARRMGLAGEHFTVREIPPFELRSAAAVALLGALCALVSILMCLALHAGSRLYERYFRNPYARILAGGALLIGLTLLAGTRDYNGSGMALIEEALEGRAEAGAFLLKMLFTAVTLGAGFKGGEIVPSLCVGATFGCAAGTVLGFSPSLCAACGMVSLFAGVTNCPVSGLLLALEMCGAEAMPYFGLAIAVTFALSGTHSLYASQTFACTGTRNGP